ncbi:MAG: hypothetical protein JXJ20_05390 [Anaerolineae bacterium]|nr:hypothetical protein [Anaerolineae bacterium]
MGEAGEFVKGYAELLKKAWSGSEAFQQRLMSNPEQVVREFGLDPGNAAINIITEIQETGTVEDQIRLWQEGKQAGQIDLYVPLEAPEEAQPGSDVELSDEMLEMVAGGGCTCCSCPCSCCCC